MIQVIFFFFLVLPVYCYQPISLPPPQACILSHVTPWTAAHQAPLSLDFSRQEYWSGLPFPSPTLSDFLAGGLWPLWPNIVMVNKGCIYKICLSNRAWSHVCTSLQGRLESIVFLQGGHLPAKSYFEREEENRCWKITSITTLNPFGHLNTLRFSSHTENVFTNPTENEHKAAPTSKVHRECIHKPYWKWTQGSLTSKVHREMGGSVVKLWCLPPPPPPPYVYLGQASIKANIGWIPHLLRFSL